ncbi:Outer-membrane lipoprotein LolB [invertebrate metagenome]|uniref:Outer-membrane lipoprotein LolB n=1 Tax=invertebrate metagenome TaxID=1711999 RepID=A0A2H9T8Y6_9ZZZZ
MKQVVVAGLVIVLAVMSGCSLFRPKAPVMSEQQKHNAWVLKQQQLALIDTWQFFGRIGVRIPGNSGSLSIEWQQQNEDYTLFLDGLFGQPVAHIKGGPKLVTAVLNGKKTLTDTDPVRLMYQMTGWQLPVNYLSFWIRGIPVPNLATQVMLDDQGNSASFQQQGWRVDYHGYQKADSLWMPSRIQIKRDNIQLTLVIRNWQLG